MQVGSWAQRSRSGDPEVELDLRDTCRNVLARFSLPSWLWAWRENAMPLEIILGPTNGGDCFEAGPGDPINVIYLTVIVL